MRTIETLSGTHGHLLLSWDPTLPESVDRARSEFQSLVDQGYVFFRAVPREDKPVRGFYPELGALEVRRVEPAEVAPRVETPPAEQPKRRGRPPKNATAERVVATRPMRGGARG